MLISPPSPKLSSQSDQFPVVSSLSLTGSKKIRPLPEYSVYAPLLPKDASQEQKEKMARLLSKTRNAQVASAVLSIIPLVNLIPTSIAVHRLRKAVNRGEKANLPPEAMSQIRSAKTGSVIALLDHLIFYPCTAGIGGIVASVIGHGKAGAAKDKLR